jgi:hypothetical protein
MMASYLTKVECEKIIRPFLNAGLSASGVVRTMPRTVVWGPVCYQGLGIRHLYTTQGIGHLLAILRHATRPTLTGKSSFEPLSRKCSWKLVFPNHFFPTPLLTTESSSQDPGSQLLGSSCQIKVTDPFPKPQQASRTDRFFMEAFVACGYRGVELRNLHNCRLHLHALQISDMCTADGRHLTHRRQWKFSSINNGCRRSLGHALIAPSLASVLSGARP